MQVNGIIAEYNPFHNGHKYQLDTARKQTDADYTIIVMSGNFMQRGTPALLDKYSRAKMALQNGADLVLELPAYYAASSAEYFAMGAVTLLDKTGVVNHLCFGSECGDIHILKRIAAILEQEPCEYTELLRSNLRQGMSFPTARTAALLQYDVSLRSSQDILSSPNNILGIEYCKALLKRSSNISPVTTLRIGSDYHDTSLDNSRSSAGAIRQAICENHDFPDLERYMPENASQILRDSIKQTPPLFSNDFSSVLHYRLLQEQAAGYERFLDVSSDLSDRIRNHIHEFTDYNGFCNLLKRKDMTYTRISRCLLHILLDMTNEKMKVYQKMDYIPYARVLGFRKDSTPLLSSIKEHASIPLVTKLADADKLLSADAFAMLTEELRINQIYQSSAAVRSGTAQRSELSIPIVIV